MSEAQNPQRPIFITDYVQEFRETKNVVPLLKAVIMVLKQQRALELMYGGYCDLFHRPSPVYPPAEGATLISILEQCKSVPHGILSRKRLIERFGETFKVALLPDDFQSARIESISQDDRRLIIGEYGEHARIACVTSGSCIVGDYYLQIPGVKHIHSILRCGDSGEFLVCTGESKKFLDLWTARDGKLEFVRRLKKRLAGFTAAVTVNGEHYFGTDFSGRPNYIATLDGKKFFFPKKAYRLYANAFQAFFDRFIVSINTELIMVGGRKTLSVFDTTQQRFIYCDRWSAAEPTQSPSARAQSS